MKILLEQEFQTTVLQELVTLEQILKLLRQQDILPLQEVTQTGIITPTREVILVLTTDQIPTVITTEVTQTLITIIESLVPTTMVLTTDLTVLDHTTEVIATITEVAQILTIEGAVDLTTDHHLVQVDQLLLHQEATHHLPGQVADLHLVASTEAALQDLRQGLPDRHPVLQEVPEVEDNEHTVF